MSDTNYERGDVLEVSIPDDWKPRKAVASRCRLIQKHGISYVLILENIGNDIYLALPCDIVPKGDAVPISIAGKSYYARISYLQVDAAILFRSESIYLLDKENTLKEIESKLSERAEQRRQAKERRKERRKNEPTIQDVLHNWPTKAIAEERRKKESTPLTSTAINADPKRTASGAMQSHKYINGYEVVALAGLNRKAFKQRIMLTDYTCDECLECSTRLVKFVNFIQINDVEGIRVAGRYCTKCDTFYDDRGAVLSKLSVEDFSFEDYALNTEYLIPQYSQKIRFSRSVQSASFAVHLNCKETKENRLITIVSNRSDRNHEQDVFHYSDWFARQLLYAVFKQNRALNIAGHVFNILKVLRLDWKNDSILSQLKIDTIILRSGGGLYGGIRQRGTELVDILLYSPFTDCFEIAHATYDAENKVYYMDAKVFRGFIEKYGNPGVKIAAYQPGARDFSTMREESILHAYGYVVGITHGVPEKVRRELLGEVMDLGIMSAESILRLLEHNISMHPKEKDMYARMDWEADKQFVMEYNVNPDRFVVATIGL